MEIKNDRIIHIEDAAGLQYLRQRIEADTLVSQDFETTGLGFKDRPFMVTAYVGGIGFVADKRRIKPALWKDVAKALIVDHKKPGLWHNAPFDLLKARCEFGLRFKNRVHDSMIQAFLINENESRALKKLSEKRWGEAAARLDKLIDVWFEEHNNGVVDYTKLPYELISWYAVQDTFLARNLHDIQYPIVQAASFNGVYDTECELAKCLVDMEYTGVRLDVPYFHKLLPELEARQRVLQREIWTIAGTEFNVSSAPQLSDVLYRKLELKPKVFTEKGQPSTDKEALQAIQHPIAKLLLEYTQHDTAINTFVKPWLDFTDKEGYLHPRLNQCGARSGRFSSDSPNCQQIPKRTPLAKTLRRGFIFPDEMVGGSNDQIQMEMVGFAHYSADPTMVAALREGKDLHKLTAIEAKIAKDEESCTPDQRKLGKGANFSIIFGCGKAKLGSFLSQDMYAGRYVSSEEALDIITKYKQRFSAITSFSYRVIQTIRNRPPEHFVQNMFGRKCRLSWDKAYVGVNRLVQSWAADMMKYGMVRAWKYCQDTDARLYLNIHDDLRWYSPRLSWREHAIKMNGFLSECPFPLSVPIRTEITRSETNWADEVEIKLKDLLEGNGV